MAVVQINNLTEFVDTLSGAGKPLRAVDKCALELMATYADREICRLCNECAAYCARGVPIADLFRYERYASDYGEGLHARVLYAGLDKQADSCIACGTCLPHCPQGLRIPQKLVAVHKALG